MWPRFDQKKKKKKCAALASSGHVSSNRQKHKRLPLQYGSQVRVKQQKHFLFLIKSKFWILVYKRLFSFHFLRITWGKSVVYP